MKYENLAKHLEKKGLKVKADKQKTDKEKFKGKTLTAKEKDELLLKMAKDLGYL